MSDNMISSEELRGLWKMVDNVRAFFRYQNVEEHQRMPLSVPRDILRELLTRYEQTGEARGEALTGYFVVYKDGQEWYAGDTLERAKVFAISRDAESWECGGMRVSHVEKRISRAFVVRERVEVPLYVG